MKTEIDRLRRVANKRQCLYLTKSRRREAIETCTILTTAANKIVPRIHNRMPVILPPDAYEPWLSGEAVSLGPYPADAMTAHPVSTLVNKPANDDPRCVEPVNAA